MGESINRAFAYLMGQKVKMGIGQQVDNTDFHVEAIDLLSNHVPCEAGIALVAIACRLPALKRDQLIQYGEYLLASLTLNAPKTRPSEGGSKVV